MSQAKVITDHDQIQKWAEARGGRPARVRDTDDDRGGGILRFDFGEPEPSLEPLSWEAFFDVFEDRKLGLLEQDETASGKTSRFFKFVNR